MRTFLSPKYHFIIFYLCFFQAFSFGAIQKNQSDVSEIIRLSEVKEGILKGNVFVYGDQSLDSLVPVRVLGAVGKPGIHYVPNKLDLLTLLSVAGGTSSDADTESITIKRRTAGNSQVLMANLDKIVSTTDGTPPEVEANDTIFVPHIDPIISDNLTKTISLMVGVASIAASLIVISRR